MLTARAQLDLVTALIADFSDSTGPVPPVSTSTALHLAIVTLLRSIGHVLKEVDADTATRKKWLAERWALWKAELIFADFIELNRNRLLKEFRGALEASNPAFTGIAAVATVGGASLYGSLKAQELREPDGSRTLDRLQEAVAFWDRHLRETEAAFQ
jgi:hypothetical protein